MPMNCGLFNFELLMATLLANNPRTCSSDTYGAIADETASTRAGVQETVVMCVHTPGNA